MQLRVQNFHLLQSENGLGAISLENILKYKLLSSVNSCLKNRTQIFKCTSSQVNALKKVFEFHSRSHKQHKHLMHNKQLFLQHNFQTITRTSRESWMEKFCCCFWFFDVVLLAGKFSFLYFFKKVTGCLQNFHNIQAMRV